MQARTFGRTGEMPGRPESSFTLRPLRVYLSTVIRRWQVNYSFVRSVLALSNMRALYFTFDKRAA